MMAFNMFAGIRLTSPLFFLLLPILIVILIIGKRKKQGEVGFAALEESFNLHRHAAQHARRMRVAWVCALCILTAFIWAGPVRTRFVSRTQGQVVQNKGTIVIAFDVSGSMLSYAFDKQRNNFEVGRDALASFLTNARDLQAGVVFFSDGAIAFTRPHDDLKAIAQDLLYLKLDPPQELGQNQLSLFSYGTQTSPALLFAGEMIESTDLQRISQTSAIVLVSDLEDNTVLLVDTFKELIRRGHNIYVLATAPEETIQVIRSMMKDNRIKLFNIASEKDIQEAYQSILGLEHERIMYNFKDVHQTPEPVRWPAFLLFWLFIAFLFSAEVFFKRARREW